MYVTGASPHPVASFAVSLSFVMEFLWLEAMLRDGWNLVSHGHTLMWGVVLWGGASWEGMPETSCSICSDFSEDPAALYVSLVRTGGRWDGQPTGGNEGLALGWH